MRRGLGLVGACLLLLTLAGCAEHWAKPGASQVERDAALARCNAESHARFPPVLEQVLVRPAYFVPPQTRCTTVDNKTQCRSFGGYWVPPTFQTIDHNAEGRRAARIDCMYRLGWMLAKDEKEAEAVTKSAPPAAVPLSGQGAPRAP
jgi:hypothetical protein